MQKQYQDLLKTEGVHFKLTEKGRSVDLPFIATDKVIVKIPNFGIRGEASLGVR